MAQKVIEKFGTNKRAATIFGNLVANCRNQINWVKIRKIKQ